MKVVILAGGLGTRISEETHLKPKPMIEIGGKPILWHIMKSYSFYGFSDFIVCCGYKGYLIKEYFANYFLHNSDVTFDMANNRTEIHQNKSEPWRVTLVDTGDQTMTGGRLKRVRHYLGDEDFCFTYGDGLSNVNVKSLVEFHRAPGPVRDGDGRAAAGPLRRASRWTATSSAASARSRRAMVPGSTAVSTLIPGMMPESTSTLMSGSVPSPVVWRIDSS